ncbi:hypothetical protein D3C77_318690 [compost metagenome]
MVNSLADHIGRVLLLEDFCIAERVMVLRKWHRSAIEPDIDHFGRALHNSAFAVRAVQLYLIHIRLMQLKIFGYMAYSMLAQILVAGRCIFTFTGVTHPDVKRGSPITIAANIPIHQILEEFAETAFANMPRVPLYSVIISDQLILHCGCLNEPALHRIVKQR